MSDETRPILAAIARLRRRLRAQRALRFTLYATAIAAALVMTATFLHALWLMPPTAWETLLIGAAGLIGIGLVVGALWRVDPLGSATRLDAASELKDRLGTAFALLKGGGARTEFEAAQLRDAARHASAARTAAAAPWRFPRELLLVLLFIGGAWGVALLRLPPPEQSSGALRSVLLTDGPGSLNALLPPMLPPDPEKDSAVPPDVQKAISQQLQELKEKVAEERKAVDPEKDSEAAKALADLEALIDDLAHERIDDRTATQRLGELDQALDQMNKTTPEQREESDAQDAALEEAASQIEKALLDTKLKDPDIKKDIEELTKQIEEKKYEEASKSLQDLMEKFLKLPKEDQERLAKMFKDLAMKFQSPLKSQLDKLKAERDRLAQKNEEAGGGSKKDKDRLNKMDRQLDQLSRKQGSSPEERKKRELDKLSRDLKNLADQMKRQKEQEKEKQEQAKEQPEDQQRREKPQQGSMEEMKKMMEEMRKQLSRQRLGQKTKMKMAELKEGMNKEKGEGKGQKARRELERLARGDRSGGKGQAPGQGSQPGQGPGDWRRTKQGLETEWKELAPKGGAGAAKAAMLGGPETDLEAKMEDDFVAGTKGQGESNRLVLKGAAAKGTGVKGYGELQIDYSMRAARQMQDEEVPPGYREYVEEYFRLIRER